MPMTALESPRQIGSRIAAALLASAIGMAVPGGPVAAQAVVQALPAQETAQLNAAMRRLAQRPADLDALLSAGNAALALRDATAAAGFFARATAIAPGDPRVRLGQARVALEQRRPVAALQGFAQAEQAGAKAAEMAADRALAYDLVGDNGAAQAIYRGILAGGDNAEARRRLALSLAIMGNRAEFEKVLYPLLRTEDRPAFRTRAFGLAILGSTDDAVAIADAMMPTDLALRMAPYLRYMPRLTKAQQAAAGNLGAFPAAAEIGRDTADIASYASAGARIAARADSSLTPAGAALGPRVALATPPAGTPRVGGSLTTPSQAVRPASRPAALRAVPIAQADAPLPGTPAPQRSAPPTARVQPLAPASGPVTVLSTPPAPVVMAAPDERLSLAEAFADMGSAPAPSAVPAAGSVDVAKLAAARSAAEAKARREAEAKAKAKREADAKLAKSRAEQAAKDAEPARHWVQIGVGRNVAAFAFDWKRLAKESGGALDGKGPWAVKYGATNRMLAGPYPTEAAARAALKRLKENNIDGLLYSSAQGEKVTKPA